jgi:hypothetical protein
MEKKYKETKFMGLSFKEAIQASLRTNGRIKRSCWCCDKYISVKDLHQAIQVHAGKGIERVTVSDVIYEDWELFERRECSFEDALEAINKGHMVQRDVAGWHIGKWVYVLLDDSGKLRTTTLYGNNVEFTYEDTQAKDWIIRYSLTKVGD